MEVLEKLEVLVAYIDPETKQVSVESSPIASKLNLQELQAVAAYLQSWIYDIAETITRSQGVIIARGEQNKG